MKPYSRTETHLAIQHAGRAVTLTRSRRILLRWDRTVLEMRPVDLLVLDNALRRWATQGEASSAGPFQITFGAGRLVLSPNEIGSLVAMVSQATERLGRRRVYWTDVEIRIVPVAETRPDAPWSYN